MPGRVERAPVVVVLDERLNDPYFVQPRRHALSSRAGRQLHRYRRRQVRLIDRAPLIRGGARYWIEAGFAVAISQRTDSRSRFQRR